MSEQRAGALIIVLLMVTAGPGWAGDVASNRVGVLEKTVRLLVPLPPLATITADDESGKTWQQTGTMSGGLDVVRGDFRQAFRAGGWSLDKTIPVGRASSRMELAIWTTRGHRILLMIWEKEPGLCGFSWGEEK
jgi:hypothetical protein